MIGAMERKEDISAFAPALLRWWDRHGRKDLPWQRNPTPYRVWVSEIMLQQTQVATVERYYDRFVDTFPNVEALGNAALDHVLHLWSGLGYYARGRNLHRAAVIIRDQFGGELPIGMEDLESLPGIGRSTAGAILALSANQSHPILDGNVRRVLARHFLVEGWPGQAAINRELWMLAEACTPTKRPGNYAQAIMDLGASVCTRRNPACHDCPVSGRCAAHRAGRIAEIPAPRPRRERPRREVVLVMVIRDGAVLLQKRPSHGVWGGLWSFPEAGEVSGVAEWCETQVGISPDRIEVRPAVRHSFTHFDLDMTPVEAHISEPPGRVAETDDWLWFKLHRPAAVGLAAPVSRLLASLGERKALGETETLSD